MRLDGGVGGIGTRNVHNKLSRIKNDMRKVLKISSQWRIFYKGKNGFVLFRSVIFEENKEFHR